MTIVKKDMIFRNMETNYYIDNMGIIYSKRLKRPMKQSRDGFGYLKCTITVNRKEYTVKTHKLVAENFLDNYDENMQIDHIDCNKENARADNLEVVTPSENMRRASINKLIVHQGNTKTTPELILEILKMYDCGESINKISIELNCSYKTAYYHVKKNRK